MNVNSTNISNSNRPCTVVSKYFSSSPVMDESLSEFKEKKEGCKGPKNSQKPTVSKAKPKKLPKRLKGQKDIRTALKSKKNEQLTYAKEFDEVCKCAGVDVDTEHLQLAIALSKSLQSEDNDKETLNKPLSSQERSKKIRTTLQEYGFSVPEIKVTNKRAKNHRKKYKLLLTTDAEKQQIISDRYTQVLFRNSCSSEAVDCHDIDYSSNKCYYIATGVTYMVLQSNSILYVGDLVEKSTSKGSLLRDWASIPGRPQSPVKRETFNMNVSEIECSQGELDIILSGTLRCAKDIVKRKAESISIKSPTIVIDLDGDTKSDLPETIKDKNEKTLTNESVYVDSIDGSKNKTLCVSDRVRSCSPDIFDDEVSFVIDSDKNRTSRTKSETSQIKVDVIMDLTGDNEHSSYDNNEHKVRDSLVMDLTQTERHDNQYESNNSKVTIRKSLKYLSQCSQSTEITRRKSNDFMEITECVGRTPPKSNPKIDNTEITSSENTRRHSDELMEVIESVAMSCSQLNSHKDCLQLQTTISQAVNKTKRKSHDPMEMTECVASTSHCILLNVEDKVTTTVIGGIVNNIIENVDLSQSSNSADELPFVQVSGTNNNKSLDDTILLNNDEIFCDNSPKSSISISKPCTITSANTLDLTDTPPSPIKIDGNIKSRTKSFFDEFVHNHSDDPTKEIESTQSVINDVVSKKCINNDEIDLTQSSNSSVASAENDNNCIQTLKRSLGKKADVSIDYDEMYDIIANTDVNAIDIETEGSVIHDETDPKIVEADNISISSQVFEISDKELEYSLNQSRHDAVWEVGCGGISVIDRDLSVRKSGIYIEKTNVEPDCTKNGSMNESLPVVKVKSTKQEDKFKTPVAFKERAVTPFKAFTNDVAITIETPTGSEYIVKTDQVTPILDYASMSTPERNKELDKYGLKPFKRKRAIQLLTHLYNQTHPIVDSCQDDIPSPSKKRKPSQPSPKKMKLPKKKSPRTLSKSPTKLSQPIDNADENSEDIYEVTNELPDIKPIECPEEDWVFQKREKAKMHSCRVPLHIALHNFVSCRRRLREAILRYEPVNIDVIHKELVATGHRYDPKDLLKYLDKKCITVKTADNNGRNNKS